MAKSVLAYIQQCPKCKTTFLPHNGEVCKCPTRMFEDHPFQPQPIDPPFEITEQESDA
jgi:hypothetical protein